jgi:putative CocE/NonD family hydrolase
MTATQVKPFGPLLRAFAAALFVCRATMARDAECHVTTSNDVMVAMRDGIRLATDLYLPASDAPTGDRRFPIILTRTPYDKSGSKSVGEYFASRGYVFVAQDTRGRYHSEGVWHFLTDDGPDGVDTAQWIEQQPWSDGKIGMLGTSYVGGTQHALALAKAPQLRTVIPVDAVSNMGYQSMRNAGAFELRFWNWIFATGAPKGSREARDPATAAMLRQMAADRKYYLLNLPLRRGTTPLQLAPEYEDWLVEAMAHGGNDEFWKQNDILDHPEHYKDIPVYLVGGWYDSWGGNTTANYQSLAKTIHGPVYLIMGPWIHGAQGSSTHGQVSFGKDAAIADELAWRLEWYDHWLKGLDNHVGKKPPFAAPVRIFVMGTGDGHRTEAGLLYHGGSWRDEPEWPLARARSTKYYFQENGGLSEVQPERQHSSTSLTFDPRKPVPTLGGNISSGDGILVQGAWDQRGGSNFWNASEPIPLSARNDILVFRTAPLPGDLEVTGEITVRLWASSSAVDTDLTAKLIDVYPPSTDYPAGFDLNLEDGIVRGRFRESLKEEKLMTAGAIYPFTIKLYPTSNVFKRGHRIRVDISSSNFPRFDVNPNTGEPLNDNRRWATAVNTVYHESDHPSCIMLPVVPRVQQAKEGAPTHRDRPQARSGVVTQDPCVETPATRHDSVF